MRRRLNQFVDHRLFQSSIMCLIILNAAILGFQTSPAVMEAIGSEINLLDEVMLIIFVIELVLRICAKGLKFFRDPWGIFDFLVVGITLVPSNEALSVLRALRVLRVFRTVSTVPRLRRIVAALLHAIPGVGAIIALLLLVFYVFSVITTTIFGQDFPEWFGNIGASMFTLFQIMTLESWAMGIVRPVMEVYPWSWVLFVTFLMLASFTVLNLFIAVIIDSMQSLNEEKQSGEGDKLSIYGNKIDEQNQSIEKLRDELKELKQLIIKQAK